MATTHTNIICIDLKPYAKERLLPLRTISHKITEICVGSYVVGDAVRDFMVRDSAATSFISSSWQNNTSTYQSLDADPDTFVPRNIMPKDIDIVVPPTARTIVPNIHVILESFNITEIADKDITGYIADLCDNAKVILITALYNFGGLFDRLYIPIQIDVIFAVIEEFLEQVPFSSDCFAMKSRMDILEYRGLEPLYDVFNVYDRSMKQITRTPSAIQYMHTTLLTASMNDSRKCLRIFERILNKVERGWKIQDFLWYHPESNCLKPHVVYKEKYDALAIQKRLLELGPL